MAAPPIGPVKLPLQAADSLAHVSAERGGAPSVIYAGPRLREALRRLAERVEDVAGGVVYHGHDEGRPWTVEVYATAEGERARRAELGEPVRGPGGARPGAGRPKGSTSPRAKTEVARVVSVKLDDAHAAQLAQLEQERGEDASTVIRAAIRRLAAGRNPG